MFDDLKQPILDLFGIHEFTEEQEISIQALLDSQDVFITLHFPLGVGNPWFSKQFHFFMGTTMSKKKNWLLKSLYLSSAPW